MTLKQFFLILLISLFSSFLQAQEEEKPKAKLGKGKGIVTVKDSIPETILSRPTTLGDQPIEPDADTAKVKKARKLLDKAFDRKKKAPLKAVLFSTILPGSGQAFNKRFWKIPIVYGGLGAAGYFVGWNTKKHKQFRQAHQYRVDDDPNTVDDFLETYPNADDLKSLRDSYRKQLEISYVGLIVVYVLTGVDAFVDAHLKTFDVSDDLSMDIQPKLLKQPYTMQPGIGLGITFRPKSKPVPEYSVSF